MGKPFNQEISKLSETYSWASNLPIEEIKNFVGNSVNSPLLAIGSGGSLTVAHLATKLHEKSGMLSKAMTPLELITSDIDFSDNSILIPSASGRNPDIANAFRFAATNEPKQLMAICMRAGSELEELSKKFQHFHFKQYDFPLVKDGFLATNTQIAFSTLLCKSYEEILELDYRLADQILFSNDYSSEFQGISEVISKDTLIVLYGKWGTPAAFDLESKFSEAALGCVQLTDYRNFGHGRHYWLEARKEKTGIIAIITPQEEKLARKTLSLIPKEIPVVKITTSNFEHVGCFELLIKTLHFVNETGKFLKVDPGKPSVPEFGRRLYRLKTDIPSIHSASLNSINNGEYHFFKRKFGKIVDIDKKFISTRLSKFYQYLKTIEENRYSSIIFDYDGTLCDLKDRLKGIQPTLSKELVRLMRHKIIIGVATGRGVSVRVDLRREIPKKYWESVIVGYYNCSDIGLLSDDTHPNKKLKMDANLQKLKEFLEQNRFNDIFSFEDRPNQITIEPVSKIYSKLTEKILLDIIHKNTFNGIQILQSKHTFDIIAPHVSKINLIEVCQKKAGKENEKLKTLCIGDQGLWPGNDYWLLSHPTSLSVDIVSPDLLSCWNISKPGHIGAQTTLDYLKCLNTYEGYFNYCKNMRENL